jgi:hypothetical protein
LDCVHCQSARFRRGPRKKFSIQCHTNISPDNHGLEWCASKKRPISKRIFWLVMEVACT